MREGERGRRLGRAVAGGLVGRGLGIAVQLVSIPLAVAYLGPERYGVWVAVTALLAWAGMADLGLGGSLTNPLAAAAGAGQRRTGQELVATAWWMLVGLATVGGLVAWALIPQVDWNGWLGVATEVGRSETGPAVAWAVGLFLVGLPLGLVFRIQTALQEAASAQLWLAAGQVAGVGALAVVTQTGWGLPGAVAAVAGSVVVTQAVAAGVLFGGEKRWLRPVLSAIRRQRARQLLGLGGQFMVVHLAFLLNLQTDHLIIAWFLGAESVAQYQVPGRLLALAVLPTTLVFPALWPALAEAISKGDTIWVRRAYFTFLVGGTVGTFVAAAVLAGAGEWIVSWWVGSAVLPPRALWAWLVAWAVIQGSMQAVACLLNAAGRLRGQMSYGLATAVLNLLLSILWVETYGLPGVMAATVVAYLVGNVGPALWESFRVLRQLPLAPAPSAPSEP